MNSQYENSTKLKKLVNALDDRINYNNNFSSFQNIVMNIYSAVGFGLDWQGKKLNVSRNFLYESTGKIETLDDEKYKQLLLWELLKITSNASTSDIDFLLNSFFNKRGKCFVVKIKDTSMALRFYFEFELTPFEKELIVIKKQIQAPTSVSISDFAILPNPESVIGFEGQALGNFASSNFFKKTII